MFLERIIELGYIKLVGPKFVKKTFCLFSSLKFNFHKQRYSVDK